MEKKRYFELLDGKLLLVTDREAPSADVVQRHKNLAHTERGIRVLKSDIEIGPVYHLQTEHFRALALVYFMSLIVDRVMRMFRVNPSRSG